MTDKHDEQAEKLLPCDCDGPGHWNCAAIYRPAVAAALRKISAELGARSLDAVNLERELGMAQEEKDDLKSELEKIKSELADKEWEVERQERAYRRRFP